MKRYLALSLAAAMALGSFQMSVSADGSWQQGWTGKEGSTHYTVDASGDTVVMSNDKVNNGKFSDSEDSIIYYASKASADSDFELKAKLHIDEFSASAESSNPNQSSVGLAVLDDLYNKTDEVAYTNSVFLGAWAENKSSDPAIYPIVRDNSAEKTEGDALSASFASSGTDIGDYELTIKKVGNAYTLTCGENSETVEVNSMSEDIYPCLYIARNVKATFSDVELKVDNRKAVALTVEGTPKTSYLYDESLDLSSAKVYVTYDDGSKEEVSDYIVKGYNARKVGSQSITIVRGNVSAQLNVRVENRRVTSMTVDYTPVKTNYYTGMAFRDYGLQVKAEFNDGVTRVLDSSSYELKYKNKTIKNGDILTDAGKANIKVVFKDSAGYTGGGSYGTFMLDVSEKQLTDIEVVQPKDTKYYVGDELDTSDMEVYAVYGSDKVLLEEDEYSVSGFDSSKAGECTVSVAMNGNDSVKGEFKVTVDNRQPEKVTISHYPRTTYNVGQSFDASNLEVSVVYDNGDVEKLGEGDYSIEVPEDAYASEGEYMVKIVPTDASLSTVAIKTVAQSSAPNLWRKAVFGQSSGYDKQDAGSTGIKADNYGTAEGTINVRSWDGNGKITNDHDGISYYYTSVDSDKDFTLEATVTVNKYLEHDNDDTKRNGQEAFGIMLRDAIPLKGSDGTTTSEADAEKDSEGVAVALEGNTVFASNMMIIGGYSGTSWPTDKTSASYEKNSNINRINMLVRTGVDAPDLGGSRIGPYALSNTFPTEGNKYKLCVQRVNGGIYARCTDLQTNETAEKYYYDDTFLTHQNKDKIYLGFFTARWADIDFTDVSLYESDRAYDQTIESKEVTKSTPSVQIDSVGYTTDSKYTVKLHSEDSNGKVSVRLNDKLIAEDMPIDENGITIDTTLRQNDENKLTVMYKPSKELALTSYEPIIERKSIVCKDFNRKSAQVYVSPNGSVKGNGTAEKPYDLDTAIGLIAPGQTIVMQEGVYYRTTPIEIELGNDGTSDKPKTLMAESGKSVVIDYMGASQGVIHSGNYWKIQNIEFRNSGDNLKCYHLGGSHNVIEGCSFHDNGDLGLQISRTYSTDDKSLWPSYNLILNCESYNNCDPSMINADGFGAKLTVGDGNVFRGCKSHHNVDDGWDLYTKVNSGEIGVVTLENCVSYKNGIRLNADGSETLYGKGGNNGFKLGGENVGVKHILKNCEAYGNLHNGVTTNSNPMLSLENVKSYNNGGANFRLYSDKPEEYSYDINGVVSYNGGEDDVIGTITEDIVYSNDSKLPILSDNNYLTIGGVSRNGSGTVVSSNIIASFKK
jgi:hypothetical protein